MMKLWTATRMTTFVRPAATSLGEEQNREDHQGSERD